MTSKKNVALEELLDEAEKLRKTREKYPYDLIARILKALLNQE